ncbi:hypothetical protein ACFWOB_03230 [Streptomyces sp. NPDC058420]|uniref:hypothetical protein n=1 Tax=Streptomyces sp. NPDC058420 TaxID=3346489 RepID=UPI003668BE6C
MPESELLGEDVGVAFEVILDRALHSGRVREALDRAGEAVDREELRTQALQACDSIGEVAEAGYRDYLASDDVQGAGHCSSACPDAAGTRRSGWLMAVLVLVAVVAAGLLAAGFGLRAFGGRPYVGDGLITAGLITGAVAAGALVGDLVWALVAGARERRGADGEVDDGREPEVAWVREEWELALLEWGMVPFLLDRIEESRVTKQPTPTPPTC